LAAACRPTAPDPQPATSLAIRSASWLRRLAGEAENLLHRGLRVPSAAGKAVKQLGEVHARDLVDDAAQLGE
jgi:hypothetical protein